MSSGRFQLGNAMHAWRCTRRGERLLLEVDGSAREFEVLDESDGLLALRDGARVWRVEVLRTADGVQLKSGALSWNARDAAGNRRAAHAGEGDVVEAPMTGRILALACAAGTEVKKGALLLTLEAMKMEHRLTAPRDGRVAAVEATVGAIVDIGSVLVRLEKQVQA